MFGILRTAFAPLLSLFILVMGNGLFTTLISLKLHEIEVSSFIIGLMTCFYYTGLVIAAFNVESLILRIGHIRSFSAFASALVIVSLLHGIFVVPWFWLILRFIGGFCTAGLFVVIESWLLLLGTRTTRGQVLAFYMVTFYGAQALGQFLINIGTLNSLLLYAVTAMLCAGAIIPLDMARSGTPELSEPASLSFKKLFTVSPSGVVGCICAGLIVGTLYGLLPLYIVQKSGETSTVALMMALTIFGGMTLQYPVGRLSDLVERRTVLVIISIASIIASVTVMLGFNNPWFAQISLFIFGGLIFTIYPVSISHGCDNLAEGEIVAGTQGLLLAYGIGAAVGPFIAPLSFELLGPNGLFIYFIIILSVLGLFLATRRLQTEASVQEEDFMVMPQSTPVVAELDPRGEG